jgi:hypothetical protein
MPIQTFRSHEEAARASRMRMAVSAPMKKCTPRGILPVVMIKPLYGDAWYAYASSPGIRVPGTHARPSSSDIDSVREWKAY